MADPQPRGGPEAPDGVTGRGRRRTVTALALVLVLLVALGGYAVADADDVVPGPLTTAPRPDPDPWPDPAGEDLALTPGDVLAPAAPGAPLPSQAGLAATLGPLLDAAALGPSTSATVVDALTGEVLLDDGAAVGRQPASTAKLLTSVAALDELGPDATLPTRTVLTTTPDGAREVDLVGGGDVLLAAGAGDAGAVVGHAGLADLAAATAQALSARADVGAGPVVVRVDDALFSGPVVAPTWSAGDVAGGYVAPVTALAVDAGRTTPDPYAPRVADPALSAGRAFAQALRAAGVSVTGDVTRSPADAAEDDELAQVRSAPVADVVAHLLTVSDNTVAEAMGRLVAVATGRPATFEGATQAVLATLARRGLDVDGTALADCSGLGDGTVVPPRLLADVLVAASGSGPRAAALRPVLDGLPVAGLTGSLADRFAGQEGSLGVVRAKTGTLTGVTGLAGVMVDADGRLLVLVLLADASGAMAPARAAADAVASALVACGCR